MTASTRLLLVLTILGLAGCAGIDLDPSPHHEFPRTENSLALPPADLQQK